MHLAPFDCAHCDHVRVRIGRMKYLLAIQWPSSIWGMNSRTYLVTLREDLCDGLHAGHRLDNSVAQITLWLLKAEIASLWVHISGSTLDSVFKIPSPLLAWSRIGTGCRYALGAPGNAGRLPQDHVSSSHDLFPGDDSGKYYLWLYGKKKGMILG